MIHILHLLFKLPIAIITILLHQTIYLAIFLSLVYGICYKLGFVHRALLRWIEIESSKLLNGAPVTLTSVEFDIFHLPTFTTKVILHDFIIHTPEKERWKWDSPLVARFGTIQTHFNLLSMLQIPPCLFFSQSFTTKQANITKTMTTSSQQNQDQHLPIISPEIFSSEWYQSYVNPIVRDIYTIDVSDVQLFLEKRRNVFNFHLLDDSLDIPDSNTVLASMRNLNTNGNNNVNETLLSVVSSPTHASNFVTTMSHEVQGMNNNGSNYGMTPKDPNNSGGGGSYSSSSNSMVLVGTSDVIDEEIKHPTASFPEPQLLGQNELSTNSSPSLNTLSNLDDLVLSHIPSNLTMNNLSEQQQLTTTTVTFDNNTIIIKPELHRQLTETTIQTQDQANEIVRKMLGAVTTLGRAVNEGDTEGLSNALRHQKDGFVNHLKKFQTLMEQDGTNNIPNDSTIQKHELSTTTTTTSFPLQPHLTSTKPISKAPNLAKEGLKVIKQVAKVVEKDVLDMKNQVDALSKPLRKKKGYVPDENPDLFRIGKITGRDIRVFAKDIILVKDASSSKSVGGRDSFLTDGEGILVEDLNTNNNVHGYQTKINNSSSVGQSTVEGHKLSNYNGKKYQTINSSGWSKPILMKEIVIHPIELCPKAPPSSSTTTTDIRLELGQPFEHYSSIILNRMMTEMAKSNTGLLLHNAFGEVFAWLEVKNSKTSKQPS